MNDRGLNSFLIIYGIALVLFIPPIGTLAFMLYGKTLYFLILSSLIIAFILISARIKGSLNESKLVNFIIFLPIIVWVISGAILMEEIRNHGNFSLSSLFWNIFPAVAIIGLVSVFLKIKKR